MRAAWTDGAVEDLVRLHEALAPGAPAAAARVVQSLAAVVDRLLDRPRLGEQLDQYAPCEVRRLRVGPYEARYALRGPALHVLRIRRTGEPRR